MKQITDGAGLNRILTRLAHEIIENNDGVDNLAVIGIRTRGVCVAERIISAIEKIEGKKPDSGILDITLYRDDLLNGVDAVVKGTQIDFDVNNRDIILCDDVLFTGRTVRAAISALLNVGRPKTIQFLAIADRGHRELPFRADYIGKNIPTSKTEKVSVHFAETDGDEGVYILKEGEIKR